MEDLVKAHGDETAEFTFVHDASYKPIQYQFNMLVERGEPLMLVALLQRNRKLLVPIFCY